MSVCCIGGVCVPVTAVLPLIALCAKWVLTKLAKLGILPQALCKKLGVDASTKCDTGNSSCCDAAFALHKKTDGDVKPIEMDSQEKWDEVVKISSDAPVLIKFSAEWCKPCKEIHPFFLTLSNAIQLVEVDVDCDGCQNIVNDLRVAMMPTFLGTFKSNTVFASKVSNVLMLP